MWQKSVILLSMTIFLINCQALRSSNQPFANDRYNQNAYANQNAYTDQYAYANQNAYTDQYAYANQNAYADQNAYTDQYAYANQNAYTDQYAYADQNFQTNSRYQNPAYGIERVSLQAQNNNPYIKMGDTIVIKAKNIIELNQTLSVPENGIVKFHLIEGVYVFNYTITQLLEVIKNRYLAYFVNPQFEVFHYPLVNNKQNDIKLSTASGFNAIVEYKANIKLLDLLIISKIPYTEVSNNGILIRNENGLIRKYKLRVKDLLFKGLMEANVFLKPGDIVLINNSIF